MFLTLSFIFWHYCYTNFLLVNIYIFFLHLYLNIVITKIYELISTTLYILFTFFHFASYISSFLPYVVLIKCYIFPHLILCSTGSFILLMVAFQILPCTINCTFFLTVTQYISLPIVHENDLSIFYPLILLNTSFIVLLLLLFRIWVLSFFHPKSVGFFFSFTVNR